MSIIHVSPTHNITFLKSFISNSLPDTFRYFKNRPVDVIKNHVLTILYNVDDVPVGYGHIDYDETNDKLWLGVCVLKEYQGKGIGKLIVKYLINFFYEQSIRKLYLTVDSNNIAAINLYIKYGFKELGQQETYSIMELSNNILYLPVSYGEAIDKMTILDIKKEKITDQSKLSDVSNEYTKLFNLLEKDINKFSFLYNLLKKINLEIWIKQDIFRDSTSDEEKYILCKDIISLNDSRFKIKNKINISSSSAIKEQKSYVHKKAVILTHLGLGDNITAIPAVRYYSTIYDEIIVISKKRNANNVRSFYADDPSISVLEINDDDSDLYIDNKKLLRDLEKTHTLITCGCHSQTKYPYTYLPFNFYDDMKLDYSIFWDYFYVPSSANSEILYNTLIKNNIKSYIFIHNMSSQGSVFSVESILEKLNFNRSTTLVVNPNINIYKVDESFYAIANEFVNKPLLDYVKTIQNASTIVVSDSSFACLSMLLPLHTTSCYLISRGVFTYNHIWDPKYGYNETKTQKKFNILNL
jgi:GNAT superfamily N-acetyltransferase